MQQILDIAYSNSACIEEILRNILALLVGYGVPLFFFLFGLLLLVGVFLLFTESIVESLIARKNRILEKVALLDNGDITYSNE